MERAYYETGGVLKLTGWSREKLRRYVANHGFPRPVYFGTPGKSKAYYAIEEVHDWLRTHAQTFDRRPIMPPKKKPDNQKPTILPVK